MSSEDLQNAYNLIREGQRAEAVSILLPLVRADPLSADGWWLLANAVDDPEQKRQALEQILKLRPDDERARRMLNRVPVDSPISEDRPHKRKNDEDDGYSEFEEPYDQVRVRQKRRGTNPLMLILAVIGLIVIVSCALCLGLTVVAAPRLQSVVEQVVLTVTFEPGLATLVNLGTTAPIQLAATPPPAHTIPSDTTVRGSLTSGQSIQHTMADSDDLWTFQGTAGQSVTITVEATDSTLAPQVYLYNADKRLLRANDNPAGTAKISLDYKLITDGTYTIDVSGLAAQADYTLTLTTK